MPDPVLARELKSLQDEMAASQRARLASPPDGPTANEAKGPAEPAAAPADHPAETAEESKLRGEFRELVDEATKFFEEAEKNVAAHPAASMVSALLVGILIGRLLGPR